MASAIYASIDLKEASSKPVHGLAKAAPPIYSFFGTTFPQQAKYFFSGPPYCSIATEEFGYQNPKSTPLFGQRSDEEDEDGDEKDKEGANTYFGDCSD